MLRPATVLPALTGCSLQPSSKRHVGGVGRKWLYPYLVAPAAVSCWLVVMASFGGDCGGCH